jgi:hypothetical protein
MVRRQWKVCRMNKYIRHGVGSLRTDLHDLFPCYPIRQKSERQSYTPWNRVIYIFYRLALSFSKNDN